MGMTYSPRDDLEEAGYMMAELVVGKLPWTGITNGIPKEDKDFMLMKLIVSKINSTNKVSSNVRY